MPQLDNPRHERWCQLVATPKPDGSVMSDMEAYQIAYGCDLAQAHSNAWRLKADEGIKARIIELSQRIHEKEAKRAILNKEKALEYLTSGVLTPIGEVDERSPLCQKVKKGADGSVEYQMVGKLEALKLLGQMQGWLGDQGTTVNVAVCLRLDME